MRERLLTLLLFSILASTTAGAQGPRPIISEVYDRTKAGKARSTLRVTPLISKLPTSGYYPIRVKIENDGKVKRTWNFNFSSRDFDSVSEGNELKSEFSVECDAKSTAEVDLIVPLVTVFRDGYETELEVQARAPAPYHNSRDLITTEVSSSWPSVMCSEEIYTRNGSSLSNALGSTLGGRAYGPGPGRGHGPGSGHPSSFPHATGLVGMSIEFGANFSPDFMSDDWRAYSGYDVCLLTEKDWTDLPIGAKTALLKWNRLGGSLLIYTSNNSTDLATLQIDRENGQGSSRDDLGWGAVRLQRYPDGGLLDPESTIKLIEETVKHTGGHRSENLQSHFRSTWPLQDSFGEKTAHILFFILVLIVFGILVGPVNLFVFARAGHRHKLFITTPIISLSASAILVVLILFQDGFGGRGQRAVLHEVGPDNTAYISQEQIARTGVLLNTGFTTSEPGYLSPVMIANSRWARVTDDNEGGKGRYNVTLEDSGLKVTGDWFQSRSEHGHIFETVRPSRGRINLVRTSGSPVVNSTFDFALEELYYRDESGEIWHARDVQQGRNVALTQSTDNEFDNWLRTQRLRFARKNQVRLDLASTRKGRFFAISNEAEGVNTLGSLSWDETYTFLTGQILRTP